MIPPENQKQMFRPLITAGMVMGAGLGGFVDGILFHQLLQTHGMVSAQYPPDTVRNVKINMFWDGIFHSFTFLMTLGGLILLWRVAKLPEVPWSGSGYIGACLMGWGFFNLCEGSINHHLLHLHHVVEQQGLSWYDYGFLGSGGILLTVGWAMVAAARQATQQRLR